MKKILLFGALFLGLSAFGQIPSYVPTNGLIGWWPFNGNANDESGNANNGTINGAILTTDHLGNSNSAYAFNGTSDYIELPYSTLWDFGLADFTLAGWFLSLDGGLDNIIRFDDGWNPPSLWGMRVKASKLNFLCKGAAPLYSPMTSDSITTGIWHHTVMVRSSSSLLIYLDGNLIHTEITATIPDIQTNGTYYPSIGRLGSFNAEYFTGDLDDIGIWNRALTECEVQNLFNSQSINSVTQSGTTLTANEPGATYQWVYCPDMTPIAQANDQVFNPTANGIYAVIVTSNGCSDTSSCYTITGVGIIENDFGNELLLYPNPTDGNFSIDLGNSYNDVKITITDISGKMIRSKTHGESRLLNLTLEEAPGVYLLKMEAKGRIAVIRLLKE